MNTCGRLKSIFIIRKICSLMSALSLKFIQTTFIMSLIDAMANAVDITEGKLPSPPPSTTSPSFPPPPPSTNTAKALNPPVSQVASSTGTMLGPDSDATSSESESDSDLSSSHAPVIIYDTDSDEEVEYDLSTSEGRDAKSKADDAQERRRKARRKEADERERESVTRRKKQAKEKKETGPKVAAPKVDKVNKPRVLGSLGSSFAPAPNVPTSNRLKSEETSEDDFGIVYRPLKNKYTVPTGPAFQDEEEVRGWARIHTAHVSAGDFVRSIFRCRL